MCVLTVAEGWLIGLIVGFTTLAILLLIVGQQVFKCIYKRTTDKEITAEDIAYPPMTVKLMGEKADEIQRYTREGLKKLEGIPCEQFSVINEDGQKLVGFIYLNNIPTANCVVCLHGLNSQGKADFCHQIMFYLSIGYNVILPTHRGHGLSEGEYIGFGAPDSRDVLIWLQYVTKRFDGNVFIHGLSMGAAAAMQCSCLPLPENVKGIIEDCGFTSTKQVLSFQLKQLYHLPSFPMIPIVSMWCNQHTGYRLGAGNSKKAVANSKVPILFIHGDNDLTVPYKMGIECFNACGSYKKMVTVKGAGHAQSYMTNPALVESEIKEFMAYCLK